MRTRGSEGSSGPGGDPDDAVHVLDAAPAPLPPSRRIPLVVASAAAAALFAVVVVVLSDTGDPAPTDVVEEFVTAFNDGDLAGVDELLAAEPSILSWPAGPPWGGGLQRTVELVREGDEPRLIHFADLTDYVGFHVEMDGSMRIEFCAELPPTRRGDDRVWVSCRFTLENALSTALDPVAPAAVGAVRFGVGGGVVQAVVVEDVDNPAPSGIPFLLWVRGEHRDVFDELLGGKITVPDYSASTGRRLLELASGYSVDAG